MGIAHEASAEYKCALSSPDEGRTTHEQYLEIFHLQESDLEHMKDMRILDLGSGVQTPFAEILKEKGIENVFSLEPKFFSTSVSVEKGNNIAGLANNLPFEKEVFDIVFASNSVPGYLETIEQVQESLEEVIRVLKFGGEARFFPLLYSPKLTQRLPLLRTGRLPQGLEIITYRHDKDKFEPLLQLLQEKHHISYQVIEGADGDTLIIKKLTQDTYGP